MTLDPQSPISPLESSTIRASLQLIVTNLCAFFAQVGFSAVFIGEVNQYAQTIIPLATNVITIWLAFKAYRGRMDATQTIRKD